MENKIMKKRYTILLSGIILFIIVLSQTGMRLSIYPAELNIQTASLLQYNSLADTFDFNTEEFEKEMEKLKEELEVLKDREFRFDFDTENFKEQMKKLKEELSELNFEDFRFEFDDTEFRNNMEELKKELAERKYSFHFDMDNFKEQMKELREELKDVKVDMKDLDIELDKLEGFIDVIKSELNSDGLINDVNEEFELELNKDKMVINGKPVPDELFRKYKDMYEEHFDKKLDDDHSFIIK
jgi:chromosome segregation ATPase